MAGDDRRAVLAGHGPAGEPAGQVVVARDLHGPVGGQAEADKPARHPDGRDLDQAVDVSLEADDGDPAHSKRSLLRGRYA